MARLRRSKPGVLGRARRWTGTEPGPKVSVMDAITMLTEQHTKLRTSFSAFDEAQTHAEKGAVFEDIADQISVHTTIEEKLFYPAAYRGESEQRLADALEEHREIKRRLVELMGMEAESEGFTDRLQALRVR